jgi:chromosome segregation ATPase
VNEKQDTTDTTIAGDVQQLEGTLRELMERTRQATELIRTLREQNRILAEHVDALEERIGHMTTETERRNNEVRIMQQELQDYKKNGLGGLSEDEKNELRGRILSLLEKINSHL